MTIEQRDILYSLIGDYEQAICRERHAGYPPKALPEEIIAAREAVDDSEAALTDYIESLTVTESNI